MNIGAHLRMEPYSGDLGDVSAILCADLSVEQMATQANFHPRATVVARTVYRQQPLDDPQRRAADWLQAHAPKIAALRQPNVVWQGYNEIADGGLTAHLAFDAYRADGLHASGAHCGWLAQSAGTPREDRWPEIRLVIDKHWRDGDVLLLHEYCSDANDLYNPWHIMRRCLPQVSPFVRDLPTVISEWGLDYMPDTGRGQAGWRRTMDSEQIVALVGRARDLYAEDDDVVGFCPFTLGRLDEWESFSFNLVWPMIVPLMVGQAPAPLPVEHRLPIPGARVSQGFGEDPAYYAQYGLKGHNGRDYAAPDHNYMAWHGTAVYATGPGRAILTRSNGYGLYVYTVGPGRDRLYAHLAAYAANIKDGWDVETGDLVGYVGYTGVTVPEGAPGTHLHYGERPNAPYQLQNGYSGYVDPEG